MFGSVYLVAKSFTSYVLLAGTFHGELSPARNFTMPCLKHYQVLSGEVSVALFLGQFMSLFLPGYLEAIWSGCIILV